MLLMWFPVRGALLLAVLFAALGSSSLQLSAQSVAAASTATSTEIRRSASGTGIADPKLDGRVESLLHGMTLEEKIGQLVQYSAGQATGPGTGRTDYKDMIAKGQIGSLLNVIDTPLVNEYQHIAVEKSRLHIPLLFGLDVIHGFRTEFPIPLGMASTWDPALVEKASHVAALEASAIGIRWTFSPMVDIARDARWGRMAEGSGEDPYLGSAMAAAYVRGYQGSRLDAPDTMGAWAMHFVGGGVCARLPGVASGCAGHDGGLCQALCGLRCGGGWPGLQLYRDFRAHTASVLSASISCGGQCGYGDSDERV